MLHRKNIHITGIVLLTGYLSVLFLNTRERHYHILPEGGVIYHVHPFQQDKNQSSDKHTHTSGDLIDLQSNLFDAQNITRGMGVQNVEPVIQWITYLYRIPFIAKHTFNNLSLRAPPVV
jgi:hypothetical protein